MKTALDCLPCYLEQALRVARICTLDSGVRLAILQEAAGLIREMDMELTPPENSVELYAMIARLSSNHDPYLELKRQSQEQALAMLPLLRQEVLAADAPLALALRLAIGGNIIDYGAMGAFDAEATLATCREVPLAVDQSQSLLELVADLPPGAKILYLADNCGEIVYDSLVVELLAGYGLEVTVAVKETPIINDALMIDALNCGMDPYARILSNGTACPGTPLVRCSPEFQECFWAADLVLSKGQGNFETLSEVGREIFFLLTVKCPVVGNHLAELTGLTPQQLPGLGELVLYGYPGHFARSGHCGAGK